MNKDNLVDKLKEYKWFILIGIIFIIFLSIVYSSFYTTNSFTMATGDINGNYHKLGLIYQERMKEKGIDVNLVNTQGSIENYNLLKNKKVDIAFIQNNITDKPEQNPELSGIASLYNEPIFVLYHKDSKLSLLSQLKGKKVSLGQKGSGTYFIAKTLLNMNNLSESDVKPFYYSYTEAKKALIDKSLDAAFMVTSIDSENIKNLVNHDDISMMKFDNYKAYRYNSPKLGMITVPQGYYNIAQNIPNQDTHIMTTLATLVSQNSLDPKLVETLLMTITELSEKDNYKNLGTDNRESFPSNKFIDFPLHKAAEVYFRDGPSFLSKYFSYNVVLFISKLKYFLLPLIPFIVLFMKIIPSANRFRLNIILKKKYKELNELERLITVTTSEESLKEISLKLDELKRLMDESAKKVPTQFQKDIYDWKLHLNLLTDALHHKIKQNKVNTINLNK